MIKLPLPPSVNAMYRNVPKVGRVKTEAYKRWQKEAMASLTFQAWDMAEPPYKVTIRLNVDHKSDIDNRVKPILDLLVKHGILTGDQWVNELHVYRDRTVEQCEVEIE